MFFIIIVTGVSLVYILAVLPGLLPWRSGPGAWFLSMCHLLGALAPWCGSFLYHLFMNHTRGEQLYHRLLQLDMLGIWVSQSIGKWINSVISRMVKIISTHMILFVICLVRRSIYNFLNGYYFNFVWAKNTFYFVCKCQLKN